MAASIRSRITNVPTSRTTPDRRTSDIRRAPRVGRLSGAPARMCRPHRVLARSRQRWPGRPAPRPRLPARSPGASPLPGASAPRAPWPLPGPPRRASGRARRRWPDRSTGGPFAPRRGCPGPRGQDGHGAASVGGRQALAPRAEVRRASADHDAPDRAAAARARLAGPLVDLQSLLHRPVAVGCRVVVDRRAAPLDRLGQHGPDLAVQSEPRRVAAAWPRSGADGAGRARGPRRRRCCRCPAMNPWSRRSGFSRLRRACRRARKARTVKVSSSGSGPWAANSSPPPAPSSTAPVRGSSGHSPIRPNLRDVPEADLAAVAKREAHVDVGIGRRLGRHDEQLAGHLEMDRQGSVAGEIDDHQLRPPADTLDPSTRHGRREVVGRRVRRERSRPVAAGADDRRGRDKAGRSRATVSTSGSSGMLKSVPGEHGRARPGSAAPRAGAGPGWRPVRRRDLASAGRHQGPLQLGARPRPRSPRTRARPATGSGRGATSGRSARRQVGRHDRTRTDRSSRRRAAARGRPRDPPRPSPGPCRCPPTGRRTTVLQPVRRRYASTTSVLRHERKPIRRWLAMNVGARVRGRRRGERRAQSARRARTGRAGARPRRTDRRASGSTPNVRSSCPGSTSSSRPRSLALSVSCDLDARPGRREARITAGRTRDPGALVGPHAQRAGRAGGVRAAGRPGRPASGPRWHRHGAAAARRPPSARSILRPRERSNSRTPSAPSSAAMCWLTADWV